MSELTQWLKNLGLNAADKLLTAALVLLVGVLTIRLIMSLIRRTLIRHLPALT